jgi:hypothetical protein
MRKRCIVCDTEQNVWPLGSRYLSPLRIGAGSKKPEQEKQISVFHEIDILDVGRVQSRSFAHEPVIR